MARKKVDRSLPACKLVFDAFKGFPSEASSQALLTEHLRVAAKKLRTKHSLPFYSMREISTFFKVPLRTVALAYEQLELEGLLNRIRGSKTMLAGKVLSPNKPIRAVIGIPLWFHPIVVSPYSRLLHWELEERLRHYGFMADMIFFREDEVTTTDFTDRILHHNLDFIIWHTPHPLAHQLLLSLKDSGARQILIQPSDNPISLTMPTYAQDWKPAYQNMAADWSRIGIQTVIIPEPNYLPSQKALKSFSTILTSHGLDVVFTKGTAHDLKRQALQYKRNKCVVAFLDQVGADAFCNEEPVVIEEIIAHCRLAFCRGPIRVPYFFHRNAAADVVGFSAVEVAERVANDIKNNTLPREDSEFRFTGKYEPQVPFRRSIERL